ncbi:MAG TPA: hypothetical protein VNI20_12180 [Fimbriimonadaceae bacterium]|nr:hypothetical protein [Fimbriimonadaceae bacterium]
MIPESLVGTSLKCARRVARESADRIYETTGCHVVSVVAEFAENGRACTSMIVDPGLERDPGTEVALLNCALARILSLLVLHLGREEAMSAAVASVSQGERLARIARGLSNESAG